MPRIPFQKGHKRFGGRKKGQKNYATIELKQLLNTLLPEPVLKKMWSKKLNSKDPRIATKTFEMAMHYMYGKPMVIIAGSEEMAPPIKIDISAIPAFRKPAA